MNIATILLGIFCFLFGIYTFIVRIKSPEKFGKLEQMKKRFGDKTGTILHIVFYTIIPIIIGIVLLISGILGVNLF